MGIKLRDLIPWFQIYFLFSVILQNGSIGDRYMSFLGVKNLKKAYQIPGKSLEHYRFVLAKNMILWDLWAVF